LVQEENYREVEACDKGEEEEEEEDNNNNYYYYYLVYAKQIVNY
jgi:hypothetical protein